MAAFESFSGKPKFKLVLTEDGEKRIKVCDKDGTEIWLEEWLCGILAFPSNSELDSQIKSLKSGNEDALTLVRDIGPMNICISKPYELT